MTTINKCRVKSSIVFVSATISEIGQYFGLNTLGRTFDLVDIIVYAVGVLFAALIDEMLSPITKFWKAPL